MTKVKRTIEEQVEYLTGQVEALVQVVLPPSNSRNHTYVQVVGRGADELKVKGESDALQRARAELDDVHKSRASFVEQFQLSNIKPKLNFVLLNEKAVPPLRATEGAAGFDITATQIRYVGTERDLDPDELDSEVAVKLVVKTGVAV